MVIIMPIIMISDCEWLHLRQVIEIMCIFIARQYCTWIECYFSVNFLGITESFIQKLGAIQLLSKWLHSKTDLNNEQTSICCNRMRNLHFRRDIITREGFDTIDNFWHIWNLFRSILHISRCSLFRFRFLSEKYLV